MTRDLACLKKEAQDCYALMVNILREEHGWEPEREYRRQNTCRTVYDQLALAAQGRSDLVIVNALRKLQGMYLLSEKENKRGRTVTEADGVFQESDHQHKTAMDIVPCGKTGNPIWPPPDDPRWLILGVAGERAGFKWGGRWQHPDFPHFYV